MERRNQKTKSVGNGEGTLYYSEALGCLVYQYFVEGDLKRKTMKQKKNESVREFKARVTDLKNKLNNGTYIAKSKDTMVDILERHIKQKYNDGIIKDASLNRNYGTLEELKICCKGFINKPIQKITIEDIEDAKKEMSVLYGQSCIDKIWGFINKAFSIAYARRKIDFNFMLDPELTKPISKIEKEKVEALTIDQQKKLEKLLDNELRNHKYRNIVKLQLNTAMRIGEVLARSTDDIKDNIDKFHIHNTLTKDKNDKVILGKHTKTYNKKTGIDLGERCIPFFDDSKEIIEEELKKNENLTNIYKLIFWDYKKNTFVTGNEVNSWLTRINEKYHITDKQFSTHVLRHTRITRWKEAGIDMSVIQYWAGHVEGSSITDNTYFTLQDEFIEKEYRKIENI